MNVTATKHAVWQWNRRFPNRITRKQLASLVRKCLGPDLRGGLDNIYVDDGVLKTNIKLHYPGVGGFAVVALTGSGGNAGWSVLTVYTGDRQLDNVYDCVICGRSVRKAAANKRMKEEQICRNCYQEYVEGKG